MTAHHLLCAQRAAASGYHATARAMAEYAFSGGSPFAAAPAHRLDSSNATKERPFPAFVGMVSGLASAECFAGEIASTGQGMRPPSETHSPLSSISATN